MFSLRAARQVVLGRPQGADAVMSPDEQSLVQRRPFGGYGVWTGLGHACSGSKSEDIGGVSLPVVHPVLGFKPKITLIGSLDTAVPEQLSDDALATLRESPSNVDRNAEADAGGVSASGGHATVVRRSEPGTTFTWVALPLEGKWEQITDAAGGKPCILRPLSSGAAATGRTDCGPDPVDCRPLSRPNPPLPQWEQQPGRGG